MQVMSAAHIYLHNHNFKNEFKCDAVTCSSFFYIADVQAEQEGVALL